jgi:hypothetical protein
VPLQATDPRHLPYAPTPDEYTRMVARVQAFLADVLPEGAKALVASRGDDQLLELPGRSGWHFPRDEDGAYAGYYPETGEAAVTHLTTLRAQGAEYLVFPRTAFWWLDHYDALRAYLDDTAGLFATDECCLVYSLVPESAAATQRQGRENPGHSDMRDLVDRLIPPGEVVTLLDDIGDFASVDLGERPVHFITPEGLSTITQLDPEARPSLGFLVVPAQFEAADAPAGGRVVTRQRHVCTIYELGGADG